MTNHSLPRYQQVKHYILKGIQSGQYQAGGLIPSEHALVASLNVSRMTVNRALRELMTEGQIVRRAGQGSFVAEKRMRGEAADIVGIREEIQQRGHQWHARVITHALRSSTKAEMQIFDFDTPQPLAHFVIVHSGNGTPVQLEDRLINPAIAPDIMTIDFSSTTTKDYLMNVAPLLRARHLVQAINADAYIASALSIKAGSACLKVNRTTWTGDNVASYASLISPGERYEIAAHFKSTQS